MTIPFMEPFRIKVVEKVKMTTREERQMALTRAYLNLFNVPGEDVYIDLLTDSGTNAMSDEQWAGMMRGDESYAGAKSFYRFEKAVQEILGFEYVLPTHQGRAAEGMLFATLVKKGQSVPNNRHFDTTQANLLVLGANRSISLFGSGRQQHHLPFKGNMVEETAGVYFGGWAENIPLECSPSPTTQPRGSRFRWKTSAKLQKFITVTAYPSLDACRFSENAWFIKIRDPKYAETPVNDIVLQMCSYADGCTMSAKKDAIVNIGGFIAFRDPDLKQKIAQNLIVHEGFLTYGGLAGRDLEAIAVGLHEAVDEDYLNYRESHTRYLGKVLTEAGLPVYMPTGGHAVYVDGGKALPHIPPSQFPAVALANALYLAGGVRTVEISNLMFEHLDPQTGKPVYAPLELLRFAIPRRVYTPSHLDYIAESAVLHEKAELIRGLRVVGSPVLRHFMAQLEEV